MDRELYHFEQYEKVKGFTTKGDNMFGKKIISCISLCMLVISLCPSLAFASELHTGSIADQAFAPAKMQDVRNLKERGVNFDLVNGKTYTIKSYLTGYGTFEHNAKIAGLKVTSAEPGFKKATFTMALKPKKMLNNVQAKKIINAFKKSYYYQGGASGNKREVVWTYWMRGALGFGLVDYKTGKNLEDPNNKAGIKMSAKTSYGKIKKYATKDGSWSFNQIDWIKVKVSIIFPKDYRDLCLYLGGDTFPRIKRTKYDENFMGKYFKYAGKNPYTARWWQTSFYKKANDNFHFFRII